MSATLKITDKIQTMELKGLLEDSNLILLVTGHAYFNMVAFAILSRVRQNFGVMVYNGSSYELFSSTYFLPSLAP